MGQAKKRGTFEQRQAEAIVREAEERRLRMERTRLAPRRRSTQRTGLTLAITAALIGATIPRHPK
jgi:hypothetical protein